MWINQNKFIFYISRTKNILFSPIKSLIIDLPCPIKISYFWKFGSLLGLTLLCQILSGILLSMHYISDVSLAFLSVDVINREIKKGWLIRDFHIRGASLFFFFMYFHIGRNLYFFSFNLFQTWVVGVIILVMSMAIAFMGYVLPWGQMSYWGATVITNFFSVVPYVGRDLVIFIWGGFAVDYPTLTRFFSLHFFLPLVLLLLVIIHMVFLHQSGSKNPLGVDSNKDKVGFFPLFILKDVFGFFFFFFFVFFFFLSPRTFSEYQNFLEAKPLVTPTHIQPEWYFLAAYAVLRCIPNKLGGVLALLLFIFILFLVPFISSKKTNNGSLRNIRFSVIFQILFWFWIINFFFLTWLGACPVEYPYLFLSRFSSFFYFFFFFFL
jgi:ubiquinol-cytochrome c reductase cytochrome b subunit